LAVMAIYRRKGRFCKTTYWLWGAFSLRLTSLEVAISLQKKQQQKQCLSTARNLTTDLLRHYPSKRAQSLSSAF